MSRRMVVWLLLAACTGMLVATVWTQIERDSLLPSSVMALVFALAASFLFWADR